MDLRLDADFVFYPYAYKSGGVFVQQPNKADQDFTFVRASEGNRVACKSEMQEMQENIPRFQYEKNESYLLCEDSSVNNIIWSEDLSKSGWTLSNGSLSKDYLLGRYLSKFVPHRGETFNWVYHTATTDFLTHYKSIFVKPINCRYIYLSNQTTFSTGNVSVFDTQTKQFTTVGAVQSQVMFEEYPNNVWRVGFSIYVNGSTRRYFGIAVGDSQTAINNSFIFNGNESFIAGMAQDELYGFSSYIKTEGATNTRGKELITSGGSLASFNSKKGTIAVNIAALTSNSTSRYIYLSDGTANNYIRIGYGVATDNVAVSMVVGGVSQGSINTVVSNSKEFHTLAFKYGVEGCQFFVDGVFINEFTPVSIFPDNTLDRIDINDGSSDYFFGKVAGIKYWMRRLSNQEIANIEI